MQRPVQETESKVAFTPGPWDINPLRSVDGEFMVCGGGTGHDYGLIATVLTEADASLIAAAPDLLRALEIARKRIEFLGHVASTQHWDANKDYFLPMIDAALSQARPKAEGDAEDE